MLRLEIEGEGGGGGGGGGGPISEQDGIIGIRRRTKKDRSGNEL